MEENRRTDTDREHILREIYEDNVRVRDRHPRGSSYTSRPFVTGVSGVFILVVAVLFAANYVFRDSAPKISGAGSTAGQSSSPALRVDQTIAPFPMDHGGDIPSARDYAEIGSGVASLAHLFHLGVKTIVIDAGHGGTDPGATGQTGLTEKEITLDVGRRLQKRLRDGYGYRVLMTRTSDTARTLRGRADFSNAQSADLFVSIHVNSIPDAGVSPLETYYFGPQAEDSALRLADIENQNSDYAVAEFNRMVQRMGNRIKLQESRKIARYVQRSLFGNARKLSEDVTDWGVKTAPFIVLVGAEAPGILVEIGAISNRDSEVQLATAEYREQIAMFLEEGIVNYLTELSQNEVSNNGAIRYAAEEEKK